MIFYYSATGNSYWAAKMLADKLGNKLISISDARKHREKLVYELSPSEALGFVFPVHAWSPPKMVIDFIDAIEIRGFEGQYVFAIDTCGDSAGDAMRVLARALGKKGLPLDARWEMVMPNNYLPMYDVDSPELERTKLEQAQTQMNEIAQIALERASDTHLVGGGFGGFLTSFVGRLFRRFGLRSTPFYATESCISCGRCARICLTGTIHMGENGKPEWSGICDHCCACINRCPVRAIQYGKATQNRGRYCHPVWRSGHSS